jgi:hypothetical protein
VHWLSWREIWQFFRTWQGLAAAVFAALATIYYGPRKMFETWDWYLDQFRDRKVMDAISVPKPARSGASLSNFGPPPPKESPYELYELAHMTDRSESSVMASLRRLQKRGKVKLTHDGKWIRKEYS